MTKILTAIITTGSVGIGCTAIYGGHWLLKATPKDVREQLEWDKLELLNFTVDPKTEDESYSNEDDDVWRKTSISWSDDENLKQFVKVEAQETDMMNSIKTECKNALDVKYGAWNYESNLSHARSYCVKHKN